MTMKFFLVTCANMLTTSLLAMEATQKANDNTLHLAQAALCSMPIVEGIGFWKHNMPFFASRPRAKLMYLTMFVAANAAHQVISFRPALRSLYL